MRAPAAGIVVYRAGLGERVAAGDMLAEIVDPLGKITYRNSFVTDLAVTQHSVAELAACARARWKIENETFNTLKTKATTSSTSSATAKSIWRQC